MKKCVSAIFVWCLVLMLVLPASAMIEGMIPAAAQQIADDQFSACKAQMGDDPAGWGFMSKEQIDKATLGKGQLVRFISAADATDVAVTELDQLRDDSAAPVWLFTIEYAGAAKAFIEVSTRDGSSYYLQDFHGGAGLFSSARSQFKQLKAKKGITADPVLYSYAGRYIFAVADDKAEWALPVPLAAEIADAGNWQAERLWTATELIQVIRTAQEKAAAGEVGGGPDFTKITASGRGPSLVYLWIIIPAGIILAGLLGWFLLRRKRGRGVARV